MRAGRQAGFAAGSQALVVCPPDGGPLLLVHEHAQLHTVHKQGTAAFAAAHTHKSQEGDVTTNRRRFRVFRQAWPRTAFRALPLPVRAHSLPHHTVFALRGLPCARAMEHSQPAGPLCAGSLTFRVRCTVAPGIRSPLSAPHSAVIMYCCGNVRPRLCALPCGTRHSRLHSLRLARLPARRV